MNAWYIRRDKKNKLTDYNVVLSVWFAQDGMFVPLFPNHSVLGRIDHQCSSLEIRVINCIDEHGIQNVYDLFCICHNTL